MRKYPSFPLTQGEYSKQAHTDLPKGTFEREFGRGGFFGPSTHLYHAHPPTGWSDFEGDLIPRAFDTTKLYKNNNSPWEATHLLYNAHMHLRLWKTSGAMDHLVRNADGDELLFVHAGKGSLFCDFGHMTFTEGDYIVLPRSTMWRLECKAPTTLLLIEATQEGYSLPERGSVGNHAVFDPGVLAVPQIDKAYQAQYSSKEWRVVIKRRDKFSTQTFPYNPLDTLGWKGDNVPVKLNWRDIRPLMSHRYHVPPSAHTTFVAPRFVVCSFVPRPIETDPGVLKVPFYHSNNDYDEVIFYHQGEFFSRDNIHPGMITLHPAGFAHGPHPKAFAAGKKSARKETDEVAVMIDTRDPVIIHDAALPTEWPGYVDSWKEKGDKK